MNISYKPKFEDKMIWASIIYHLLFGLFILISPNVRHVTGSFIISELFGDSDVVFYFIASVISIVGLIVQTKWRFFNIICLIPQQIFLIIALLGQIITVIHGVYPDGYIPVGGSYFLVLDQYSSIVLCITHALAMVKKWSNVFII